MSAVVLALAGTVALAANGCVTRAATSTGEPHWSLNAGVDHVRVAAHSSLEVFPMLALVLRVVATCVALARRPLHIPLPSAA